MLRLLFNHFETPKTLAVLLRRQLWPVGVWLWLAVGFLLLSRLIGLNLAQETPFLGHRSLYHLFLYLVFLTSLLPSVAVLWVSLLRFGLRRSLELVSGYLPFAVAIATVATFFLFQIPAWPRSHLSTLYSLLVITFLLCALGWALHMTGRNGQGKLLLALSPILLGLVLLSASYWPAFGMSFDQSGFYTIQLVMVLLLQLGLLLMLYYGLTFYARFALFWMAFLGYEAVVVLFSLGLPLLLVIGTSMTRAALPAFMPQASFYLLAIGPLLMTLMAAHAFLTLAYPGESYASFCAKMKAYSPSHLALIVLQVVLAGTTTYLLNTQSWNPITSLGFIGLETLRLGAALMWIVMLSAWPFKFQERVRLLQQTCLTIGAGVVAFGLLILPYAKEQISSGYYGVLALTLAVQALVIYEQYKTHKLQKTHAT